MEISIHYFRNIEDANVAVVDKKVNFIVGPCGAGKSSIIDAISSPLVSSDTTVGHKPEETKVLIDGQEPDYERTSKYGLDRQEVLFQSKPNKDGYRVFIGDETQLRKLEDAFDDEVALLWDEYDELSKFRGQIDQLTRNLSKPGAKGTFTPKSKLGKAKTAMQNATSEVKETLDKGGTALLEWRINGMAFLENGEDDCPFCGQHLTAELIQSLQNLEGAELKEIKPLFEASDVLSAFDLSHPDLVDEQKAKEFESELLKLFKIKNEVDKLLAFCAMSRHVSAIDKVPDGIHVDEIVYERFPNLKSIVNGINAKTAALKKLVGKMMGAFNRLVNANVSDLNDQLESLGIPYAFVLDSASREERTAGYRLVHTNAGGTSNDMRNSLSYGERNLVALLLFLHNKEDGMLLIDDPASSYDDFRRSQIYGYISKLKEQTVLVVSHDHAFVRRAVRDNRENIGSVQFVVTGKNGLKFTLINKESFVNLDTEIIHRIKLAASYEQKVINLRLYYEIHKEESHSIYQYLSALLHGTEHDEIVRILDEKKLDEQAILHEIAETVGVEFNPTYGELKISDSSLLDKWTDFELLIFERERLKRLKSLNGLTPEQDMYEDMLDDLVHMNDCMLFTLNPYEYAIWSPELQKFANDCRGEMTTDAVN